MFIKLGFTNKIGFILIILVFFSNFRVLGRKAQGRTKYGEIQGESGWGRGGRRSVCAGVVPSVRDANDRGGSQ